MKFSGLFALQALAVAVPVQAAFQYFDPTDSLNFPERLSQTGLFKDISAKTLTDEAVHFAINSPLWSDGSAKKRWIILRPGKSIPYDDTTDFFAYPDSTVFVKTFLLERVEGDSSTRVHWETRLLLKKHNGGPASDVLPDWYGFSYRWNAAQTDAFLTTRNAYASFDTNFSFVDARGRQTYKKWSFPSREKCWYCHHKGRAPDGAGGQRIARAVLGFFPAQLKRPSPTSPDTNQILALFNRGVFTGVRPGPSELARRFKGIGEPIPAGLSAEERFRVIDTMARSYLAANCSGCHGTRNGDILNCPSPPNFDFHNLKPEGELANQHILQTFNLNDTTTYDSLFVGQGRFKYLLAVSQYGFDTRSGDWDLALPPGNPDTLRPALLVPGYPSLSEMLYRQWIRNSPWMDSALAFRALMRNAEPVFEGTLDSAEALRRKQLFFSAPWGSLAWRDSLSRNGYPVDSALSRYTDGYSGDGDQMPPLATFVPDTAALRILGEWLKNYRSASVLSLRRVKPQIAGPYLRGNVLHVPESWIGPAAMLDLRGRSHRLASAGKGAYVLPPGSGKGLYLFRVGRRHFKLSRL